MGWLLEGMKNTGKFSESNCFCPKVGPRCTFRYSVAIANIYKKYFFSYGFL